MNASTLNAELVEYFASLLRTPRDQIQTTVNVLDLGADSIMLMEARSWIEKRTGQRIEIHRFFDDLNTIDALAAHLTAAGAAIPGPATSAAAPAAVPAARPDLALMRHQLALVAEVIEAQNRTVAAMRRRPADRRPPADAARETEAPAA